MRIAILANRENSFIRPLAEGLGRMLTRIGVESVIFYEGLSSISRPLESNTPKNFIDPVKLGTRSYYKQIKFVRLMKKLQSFDAIVVVGHLPLAFMKVFMRDDDLRERLPNIPIILYDLVYLPTRGAWARSLKEGNDSLGIYGKNHYGIERFDYYLCVSAVSDYPMPKDAQPMSLIGVDINDGSLTITPKDEFIALLDFKRDDHILERRLQISALEETNTKYIELEGHYTIEEIRDIYKKCSIYFIAHRESFGLPICELQACGSVIFTPYSEWCPSHWLKDDLTIGGAGFLSSNFVVYGTSKKKLMQEIYRVKNTGDPVKVFKTFSQNHSYFFDGDESALRHFIQLLTEGKIHSKSHKSHQIY